MNCKEAGFRAFYKRFAVFEITEQDKELLKEFPEVLKKTKPKNQRDAQGVP